MKLREAKQNEKRVKELLNKKEGCVFILHRDHYSAYDAGGVMDDVFTIVEIKKRKQVWNEWYIEKDKLVGMFYQATKEGFNWKTGKKYICCSVDDEHWFYNVEDILKRNKKESQMMNQTTAQGFANEGIKVKKEVYLFPFSSFEFKL